MSMMTTQAQEQGTSGQVEFEARGIDEDVVAQLMVTDDAGNPPRVKIEDEGGSPLRCCLRASRPGERVALVSYAPLRRWAKATGADPGAYDEVGPVFIHTEPCGGPASNRYPEDFLGSPRVFRAYRADGSILRGQMASAEVLKDADGAGQVLSRMLADPRVAVLHARALEFGCFTFEVRRAAD
jgi:hypothetical protein